MNGDDNRGDDCEPDNLDYKPAAVVDNETSDDDADDPKPAAVPRKIDVALAGDQNHSMTMRKQR